MVALSTNPSRSSFFIQRAAVAAEEEADRTSLRLSTVTSANPIEVGRLRWGVVLVLLARRSWRGDVIAAEGVDTNLEDTNDEAEEYEADCRAPLRLTRASERDAGRRWVAPAWAPVLFRPIILTATPPVTPPLSRFLAQDEEEEEEEEEAVSTGRWRGPPPTDDLPGRGCGPLIPIFGVALVCACPDVARR